MDSDAFIKIIIQKPFFFLKNKILELRSSEFLKLYSQAWDNWKPFKNDEKCFLFHLKSSFRSQDI